jgi:hypothetical protein
MAEYMCGRMAFFRGDPDLGTETLERALALLESEDDAPRAVVGAAAIAHSMLERAAESRERAQRSTRMGRDEGPLSLAAALALETHTELWFGRWQRAEASGSEGLTLSRDLGLTTLVGHFQVALARIDAARGAGDAGRERLDEAIALARQAGQLVLELEARAVLGNLELALGRHAEAVGTLVPVAEEVERIGLFDRDVAPEPYLVEALVRLDRLEAARSWLSGWEARGSRASPRWGAALLSRCSGLLDPGAGYEACFAEAVDGHEAVAGTGAAARPGRRYARRSSGLRRSTPSRGATVPGVSCERRARRCGAAAPRRATS